MDKVPVLDQGYVRLVNYMGDDLAVVNAARVSFAKESINFDERDEKLIKFLIKNGHTSPFRHAFMKFEVKAPLMVARQWWKYVVGSDHTMDGWNEMSRRYVQDEPEFYIPEEWRAAPENRKQGSGGTLEGMRLHTDRLASLVSLGQRYYDEAIADGIATEQARLFLPAYGMYTSWIWTASLQSLMHFLRQRLAHDAQWEFQQYAKVVGTFVEDRFPVCYGIIKQEIDSE